MLKRIALDEETPAEQRSRALAALVERRVPGLASDLHALTADRALRGTGAALAGGITTIRRRRRSS